MTKKKKVKMKLLNKPKKPSMLRIKPIKRKMVKSRSVFFTVSRLYHYFYAII